MANDSEAFMLGGLVYAVRLHEVCTSPGISLSAPTMSRQAGSIRAAQSHTTDLSVGSQ